VLCVSLQGDYKFINCMVNATQFHVAGLSKFKKEDYLAFNEEGVAIQRRDEGFCFICRLFISIYANVHHFPTLQTGKGRGKSSQCS